MKIVLAGAFGNLGRDILRSSVLAGHDVLAVDKYIKDVDFSGFTTKEIDVLNPKTLEGICEGADIVITTIGLTTKSKTVTHYDIDLNGNKNLLSEALRAGVKKFIYISVIKVDTDPNIPMLDAKHKFELTLKESNIPYVIYRPTGYFYDIAKVFKPMVEKGTVTLLKGIMSNANVIDTPDFADYIINNLDKSNETIEIGGKETYSYEEIARLFFESAKKPVAIKYAPPFLFDILILVAKLKNNGTYANMKFGKWTLVNDMEAILKAGKNSFKEYIKSLYK